MAFEQLDSGHHDRFGNRILGSVGDTRHTITGPTTIGTPNRPQLSLVPEQPERYEVAPATIEDEEWQERALCAQTDPEAFFPEKGGSTREAKRICLGCEVKDRCLEYALGHDERFGIWGGLSERERRRLKRRAV